MFAKSTVVIRWYVFLVLSHFHVVDGLSSIASRVLMDGYLSYLYYTIEVVAVLAHLTCLTLAFCRAIVVMESI